MTRTSGALVTWAPRVAGILMACFLGIFALDAFEGRSVLSAIPAFAIHLIPSFLVLAVVAVAWKVEWIGAAAFLGLAALYAVMVRGRIDWVAAISGPLVVIGVLFLASWRQHRALHTAK